MGVRQRYIHASSTARHVDMLCWLRSPTLLPKALESVPALYSSSYGGDQIPHYIPPVLIICRLLANQGRASMPAMNTGPRKGPRQKLVHGAGKARENSQTLPKSKTPK